MKKALHTKAGSVNAAKITIELTDQERLALDAICIRFGSTPADILKQFVRDLTGSLRNCGSDEREMAMGYLRLARFDRTAAYCPEGYGLTDREYERILQLESDAYIAGERERMALMCGRGGSEARP